ELSPHVDRVSDAPRVYVDANMPARVVAAMRHQLKWDVYFVMEHDDLRRAADGAHFRLSRQMRRTLVTLDRDYLDDRRYPARESGGVLVLSAPRGPRAPAAAGGGRQPGWSAPRGTEAAPASGLGGENADRQGRKEMIAI